MSKNTLRRRLAALMALRKQIDKNRAKKQFYDFAMRQFTKEMFLLIDDLYEYGHGVRPKRRPTLEAEYEG